MSKSIKQKEALANSRNKELAAVRKLDPQFSCQGEIGTFIGLYLQSEVFAKKLQRYYRTDTNKKGKDELNRAGGGRLKLLGGSHHRCAAVALSRMRVMLVPMAEVAALRSDALPVLHGQG